MFRDTLANNRRRLVDRIFLEEVRLGMRVPQCNDSHNSVIVQEFEIEVLVRGVSDVRAMNEGRWGGIVDAARDRRKQLEES